MKLPQNPVHRALMYVAAGLTLLVFLAFIGPALVSSRTDAGPLAFLLVIFVVAVAVVAKILNRSK